MTWQKSTAKLIETFLTNCSDVVSSMRYLTAKFKFWWQYAAANKATFSGNSSFLSWAVFNSITYECNTGLHSREAQAQGKNVYIKNLINEKTSKRAETVKVDQFANIVLFSTLFTFCPSIIRGGEIFSIFHVNLLINNLILNKFSLVEFAYEKKYRCSSVKWQAVQQTRSE